MKHTPLYDQHVALSANMVNFHGWALPLHYGSQLDEHHAVRKSSGMFDVSHMHVVDVKDTHAEAILQRLLANDVNKLAPGQAQYSVMLNHQGGIIDDLIVYFLASGHYRIVFNGATRTRVKAWLAEQSVPFESIEAIAIIAVQGPEALSALCQAKPELDTDLEKCRSFHCFEYQDWLVAKTGYTGEKGVEIILPASEAPILWQALLDAGVKPCGLGARDSLRLEAGMHLSGVDMDESTLPKESGLNWVVDLMKEHRDFIGRDAHENHHSEQVQVSLVLEGKGVMRPGQQLILSNDAMNEVVGTVTSGGYGPTVGGSIALARINIKHQQSPLSVMIRHRPEMVRVVGPGFYRKGKVLIQAKYS